MLNIDFKNKRIEIAFMTDDKKQWEAVKAVVDAYFEKFPAEASGGDEGLKVKTGGS